MIICMGVFLLTGCVATNRTITRTNNQGYQETTNIQQSQLDDVEQTTKTLKNVIDIIHMLRH